MISRMDIAINEYWLIRMFTGRSADILMSYFVCDVHTLTIHLSSFTIGQLAFRHTVIKCRVRQDNQQIYIL